MLRFKAGSIHLQRLDLDGRFMSFQHCEGLWDAIFNLFFLFLAERI